MSLHTTTLHLTLTVQLCDDAASRFRYLSSSDSKIVAALVDLIDARPEDLHLHWKIPSNTIPALFEALQTLLDTLQKLPGLVQGGAIRPSGSRDGAAHELAGEIGDAQNVVGRLERDVQAMVLGFAGGFKIGLNVLRGY